MPAEPKLFTITAMGSNTFIAVARQAANQWRKWRARRHTQFGKQVHISRGCSFWAPHRITVGDQCYFGKDVTIETNAKFGRWVLVANRVAFIGRNDHDFSVLGVPVRFGTWIGAERNKPFEDLPAVTVNDDVWIGYGATILSGVTIGRGAIISAGSVVTRDVLPYEIVAGVPARRLRMRFESELERQQHEKMMSIGSFSFSEKGFEHWTVKPGKLEA